MEDNFTHSDIKAPTNTCWYSQLSVIDCVDLFIRPVYKQIIVHSLNYFINNKGLEVFAWSLLPPQLQLLARAKPGYDIGQIENEFKEFTSEKIQEAIKTEPDYKKKWLVKHFEPGNHLFGKKKNQKKFEIWQESTSPVLIDMNNTENLLNHYIRIHDNAVRDRMVYSPADFPYSSARDYAGYRGVVNITKISSVEHELEAISGFSGGSFVRRMAN